MEEKLKIRQLGLRYLQKQKRQAAMMTLKPQVLGVVFLPRATGLHRLSRKRKRISKERGPSCHEPVVTSMVFFLASFGISGWMRSRGLGIATTSLSLIGALAVFAALRPFLHVVPAP
jgi:hypothetical protein